ncbi:ABC transporter permease [Mucilaginibacter boryungensis]|uniref:ABC transporter permease n=1 Tax=Mucilaginibacter boryungensis TaxID=768480 RepID=A0ABR9XIN2_9SPHI|nr:ABC transporter permease [Mucilaginibacter boryungensis]MBE9666939.1 ABC transporter permease [Mucilaginibacter boryungensis]
MLRNYIKTAFRSLLKNKTYSFLNIFGLAIGIACAAFIFLWVENEVSFDSVHQKKDRLFIAKENQQYVDHVFTHSSTPGLFGPAIKAEVPGIANVCRTSEDQSFLFSKGDKAFYATGIYAETSLFSMFTMPFVQGNASRVLTQPHSMVITESAAKKFFGSQANVVGQTIKVDNKQDYVIEGVVKDNPANSTFQFEWVMPFQPFFDASPWLQGWGNNSLHTYVELKPGVSPETVNKQLYNFLPKKLPGAISHVFLFGMKDWHLRDVFKDGKQTGEGRIQNVRLFSVIAWIILLIACINFMNLATARSEKRAREVGVRKVLGAGKKMLIAQFIGEALFMALLSAAIAVLIVLLLLPAFNLLVEKQLTAGFNNPLHITAVLLVAVVCGLIAGSYPSLYLSSFNPVSVLKGIKLKDGSAAFVRKGLVVTQFTISIVLIICTIIVYQQIQHVKSRQLGFNRNNLIEMDAQGNISNDFARIQQDMLNTGYVDHVALADHPTLYDGNNTSSYTWEAKPAGSVVLISRRYVTPEFMSTLHMKLLEGRNLTIADTTNESGIVITQSLEKLMGKGSAIGKVIRHEGNKTASTVVGVVNDYVYGNMYGKSDPVVFLSLPLDHANYMYIHFKPGSDVEKVVASIQSVMKKDNPAFPFNYRFLDTEFNKLFTGEMLVSKLSRVFATLAIIISCLGLFGLAAYTAERRTKEIGIRKVLGASVSGITGLLSKDFLQLVIVSCVLAFPVAYYMMHNWLSSYRYRIDMQWWVFGMAGLAAIIIALVTISFQSIKAAIANPVKSLRNE